MSSLRVVVLGDSVTWGQGLLPEQKFHQLVIDQLTTGSESEVSILAHSGATIGVESTTLAKAANGEVPKPFPTIWQQCENFCESPETVDLVIVNGGINDVDIHFILNPFTQSVDLGDATRKCCYRDVKVLLALVLQKFSNDRTKIVFTGYYPILSEDSVLEFLPHFLMLHSICIPNVLTRLGDGPLKKVVSNCLQFWRDSNQSFRDAIDEINGGLKAPRVLYAEAPFSSENAALASKSWLWGIDFAIDGELAPEDPMRHERQAVCDLFEPDLVSRYACYRASAGHPNVQGARRYAEAILGVLKR